jgi:hypothetical protein
MRLLGLAILAASASTSTASAQTSASVLQRFGYIGHWAQDCAEPAKPGNPHMIVSVLASGGVEVRNKLGPEYQDNVNIVVEARTLAADRVMIKTHLNNNELREWEVTRANDRIRTMVNRRPDGTFVTKDGLVVASGKPTPWLNRCR